jgi:hypothetical protein
MRAAVIVLSLLGVAACAVLGVAWASEAGGALRQLDPYRPVIALNETMAQGFADLEQRLATARALLAAAALGSVGVALLVTRRPRLAAFPLVVAGALPAVFDLQALMFSFLLLVAGGLALGQRPHDVHDDFRRAEARGPHG